MNIRRINLWAGSGAGKTKTRAYLFDTLSLLGYNIEEVTEAIKPFVIDGRKKKSFDTIWFFGEQLHREDILLANNIDHIVTDSPVLLQTFYANREGDSTALSQVQIGLEFEKAYPSFNIFLDRTGIKFNPIGRYEKHIHEAIVLDIQLKAFMETHGIRYVTIPTLDRPEIVRQIVAVLGPPVR